MRCLERAQRYSSLSSSILTDQSRPQVAHAALAAQHLQHLIDKHGGGEGILAGDFNFIPGSPPYQLITGGGVITGGGAAQADYALPARDWDDWYALSRTSFGLPARAALSIAPRSGCRSVNVCARVAWAYPPPTRAIRLRAPVLSYPMRSAYAELGGEPEVTNHASTALFGDFSDCIDYIFVSRGVRVLNVLPLRKR